jgi:TolA-binding protein
MSAFRAPAAVLLSLAGWGSPGLAQNRQDLLQIQRDVAQLQDQVKQLQKAQDEKIAALQALVQQSLDASSRLSSALSGLQTSLTTALSEQQRGVVAPMAALSKEVEHLSGEFRSLHTNVSELGTLLGRLDTKLADVSSAVRSLSAPPPPPPVAAAPADPVPPPGVTAEGLFNNARADFSGKRDELALQGFADYLKFFPKTENAPRAQHYIGLIYDRNEQYEDAVKAFDAVLERFPENPYTAESMYWKGVELIKLNQRAEATTVMNDYLKRYPDGDRAAQAKDHLRNLRTPPPKQPRGKGR